MNISWISQRIRRSPKSKFGLLISWLTIPVEKLLELLTEIAEPDVFPLCVVALIDKGTAHLDHRFFGLKSVLVMYLQSLSVIRGSR